jgi:hypothetical protein
MTGKTQTHDLQGYSYEDRQGVLSTLTSAFSQCGGWILERKTTSPSAMEFRIEIQLHGIVELYASLVGTGLELTRATHETLTALCTSRHYLFGSQQPNRVLCLRLELNFLEDVTLHSLLMTGSGVA